MRRSIALPCLCSLALGSACFDPEAPADATEGTDTGSDTGTASLDDSSGSPASCDDLEHNGDETDVDCGGSCGPCLDGQGCVVDDDCESQWCNEGTCASPSCDDGVLDGDETDVDCGGGCLPCDDGASCAGPQDCMSGVCTGDVCQAAVCGDGVANDPGEACDTAGDSETCDADCTEVECGDGVINAAAGEVCEDGVESATCDVDCTAPECGDGLLNASAGELCDDGGESATCDADCTAPECGDGLPNASAGEECDDGGESAACDTDCTMPMCGDGLPNVSAGEQCDDGNGIDDDQCSNACLSNACSFDVGLLPLMVHPSNHYGDMDFDGACNLVVAGAFGGALHRISPAGVVSTVVPSFGGAGSVNGVAYRASDDLVYVTTDSPAQLWSVDPAGAANLVMDLPTTTNAIEIAPPGFGAFGNQVVGVTTGGEVLAIEPATGASSIVSNPGAGILSALAFDPTGSVVYVAAYNNAEVIAVSPAGGAMSVVAINGPDGLEMGPAGTLFVARTSGAQEIIAVDPMTGTQNVIATPVLDGGYYVTGLRWSASGHLLMKVEGANIDYLTP